MMQQVKAKEAKTWVAPNTRFLQPGKPGAPLAMTRHQLRQTTPEYGIPPGVFIRFGEILQLLECLIVGAARCALQLCIDA
ncbi:hypothetical protein AB3X91_42260 [Paraburkholderia sp. BR14263]|uniref:Uncharacterized protein n=1 Tax=Paraburkholderia ferrariae TaxID=386056 RepID=A0ABU9S275_9BURK